MLPETCGAFPFSVTCQKYHTELRYNIERKIYPCTG
jgi:hypothetical protein